MVKKTKKDPIERVDGRFAPGVSGNPKGRPKKPQTIEISDALPEGFHERVGHDSLSCLEVLLETTQSRSEAKHLAKELRNLQYPTKGTEQPIVEVRNIEIRWMTPADLEPKTIEGPIIESIPESTGD